MDEFYLTSKCKLCLRLPIFQCNHLGRLAMLIRFPARIVQMRDQQIMGHAPITRGRHLARVCTAVCSDVECIASNEIHGMLSQQENRAMTKVQLQGEV